MLASGLLAAVGVSDWSRFARPWRAPLVLSALLGLVCLTVAHTSAFRARCARVQTCSTGRFALLRNVSKVDPCSGCRCASASGSAFALPAHRVAGARGSRRAGVAALVVAALTLGMAQPAMAMNLRTPGWDAVPDYWHQTADYLDEAPGDPPPWVIPGSGFGVQTWGWTMDEPMGAVAKTPG